MPQCTFSFILWQTRTYAAIIGFLLLLLADDCNARGPLSVTVTPTNPTCQYNNGSFVVNVTGGTPPYSYLSNAAQQSNITGIFTNLAGGVFDIIVSDAAGQQTTSSVTLTNTNNEATFNAVGADPTGCNTNDGTITVKPLSGLPPYAYSIDNGATFQNSNVFFHLGPGTYGIFMKDGNGCITAPWSTPTTSYADFEYFGFGNEVNLSSSHVCLLGLEPLLADPGCGNVNFIEIFGGIGGTAPYIFSLDGNPFAALTQDGYYLLSPGKHTVDIKDNGGLETSYTYNFPSNCPVLASPQGASCGSKNGSITVTGGNGFAPFTYSIDGIHFQASNVFSGLTAGSYTIIMKDANGVTGSATTIVTSGCSSMTTPCDNLNLTMGADTTICQGTATTLTVQSNATGFAWVPAAGLSNADIANPVAQPSVTTIYSVTATLGTCTQTGSVTVTVIPPPKVFAGDDTAVQIDQSLPLQAMDVNNSGFTSYQWSPAQGLSNPFSQDPTALIRGNITYFVTATTPEGCAGMDSIVIEAFANSDIIVPNAFTPNGDGHNDVLRAIAVGMKEFRYFTVFNRWGQQVFTTSNSSVGWDGTLNGRPLVSGAYVWMAGGVDYTGKTVQRRGVVILIR
jgi:gliding motility-associated-like protein